MSAGVSAASAGGTPDAADAAAEVQRLRDENGRLCEEVKHVKATLRGVVAAAETSEERLVNKVRILALPCMLQQAIPTPSFRSCCYNLKV